jgi:heme exporter protein C
MILMALAFWLYSIAVALLRVRCIIRERETPRSPAAHDSLVRGSQ